METYPSDGAGENGGSGGGGHGQPGVSGGTGSQPNPSVYGTTTPYGNNGAAGINYNPGDHRIGGGGGGASGAGNAGDGPPTSATAGDG